MSDEILHPSWCVGDGRDEYSGRTVHKAELTKIRINTTDHVTVRMVQDIDRMDEPYVVFLGEDCDELVTFHMPLSVAEVLKEALVGLLVASDLDVRARVAGGAR